MKRFCYGTLLLFAAWMMIIHGVDGLAQTPADLAVSIRASDACQLAQPSDPAYALAVVGGNPACLVTLTIVDDVDDARWYIAGQETPIASGLSYSFSPTNDTQALTLVQKFQAVAVKFKSRDDVSAYKSQWFAVEIGQAQQVGAAPSSNWCADLDRNLAGVCSAMVNNVVYIFLGGIGALLAGLFSGLPL